MKSMNESYIAYNNQHFIIQLQMSLVTKDYVVFFFCFFLTILKSNVYEFIHGSSLQLHPFF